MKISILTLFPDMFKVLEIYSIIGKAIQSNKVSLDIVNIRDFSEDKHKHVDDYPYGGGLGMVMQPEPIYNAIENVKTENSKIIYLSPQGKNLNQNKLNELSKLNHLILLNGHYEGIDNRIIENYVDEEISIGNFVVSGGEIPSMLLIDGVIRLLPNVLNNEESFQVESHYNGLLEYPQYTRPYNFRGFKVPDILLSGNHKKIEEYRLYESIKNTLNKRPDLINENKLTEEQKKILEKIINERRQSQ